MGGDGVVAGGGGSAGELRRRSRRRGCSRQRRCRARRACRAEEAGRSGVGPGSARIRERIAVAVPGPADGEVHVGGRGAGEASARLQHRRRGGAEVLRAPDAYFAYRDPSSTVTCVGVELAGWKCASAGLRGRVTRRRRRVECSASSTSSPRWRFMNAKWPPVGPQPSLRADVRRGVDADGSAEAPPLRLAIWASPPRGSRSVGLHRVRSSPRPHGPFLSDPIEYGAGRRAGRFGASRTAVGPGQLDEVLAGPVQR